MSPLWYPCQSFSRIIIQFFPWCFLNIDKTFYAPNYLEELRNILAIGILWSYANSSSTTWTQQYVSVIYQAALSSILMYCTKTWENLHPYWAISWSSELNGLLVICPQINTTPFHPLLLRKWSIAQSCHKHPRNILKKTYVIDPLGLSEGKMVIILSKTNGHLKEILWNCYFRLLLQHLVRW